MCVGHSDIWGCIQTYGGHLNIWVCPNIWVVSKHIHTIYIYIYIYQNNPKNFVEINFSSKIHVDTMKMEHSQSGSVCSCPNNITRSAAAILIIRRSLVVLRRSVLKF